MTIDTTNYIVGHGGNGIVRLKIKKKDDTLADQNGFVWFDVDPRSNPFEFARDVVHSLEPTSKYHICALVVDDTGTKYNWDGVKTGDVVEVWGIDDLGPCPMHDIKV